MSHGAISVERQGRVLCIGINRPEKRNAFSVEMYRALGRAYGELERDPELFCGLLFAHGDHFTGGLDLVEFSEVFRAGEFPSEEGSIDPVNLFSAPRTKPVVAAVQGICFTIGIELLLATDVRVASKTVRFGQIEVKRGIYPVGGATLRLPREVGWGNAMRWLLTGGEFGADEALRIGMVQEVVAAGEEKARALALAQEIAEQAPLGVYATLTSARIALYQGEQEATRRLLPDLQPILQSEDVQEGLASFVARRKADFKGR